MELLTESSVQTITAIAEVGILFGVLWFSRATARTSESMKGISESMAQSYKRLEWLTGAMETHSQLMLQIEAQRGVNGEPIDMIWWDPNRETPPDSGKAHGKPVETKRIYLFLPEKLRIADD